ncbi:hypothetical protein OSB04_023262 [Centaurea solstitialis]|uniref:DDE Tnp4 domain-containing protein n=1 Tax=Centaurea solstitialis TaxID=347529 RepID=A0AA38SIV0_9ASTR|nr:hypothetical protein OSB04_023262 [Centaurea solstitialis]
MISIPIRRISHFQSSISLLIRRIAFQFDEFHFQFNEFALPIRRIFTSRDTNLEIYESFYAPLFRDSVAVGDRTKAPIDCENNNDPTNEDHNEGNGDSDGIDLGEQDEPLFPASSSSKRKKSKTVTLTRSTKGKSSGSSPWVEKLDGVIEAISTRSTQIFPPKDSSPTTQECMDIVTCFPEFEEGSRMYCRALRIFLKKQIRENFMVPKTHAAKMEFLKLMMEEENRGETVSRHFHTVLTVVLKLSANIIKPNANYNEVVPTHILNKSRYYPAFKDCIGAIDGTHVKAMIQEHEQAKYIDKYYVVDAGYPNTKGYLAPYKGTNICYHIPDFRRGQTAALRAPKGAKETFNYLHSSLRNVIERTFGVWKARWAILKDMHPGFTYETQVDIVLASMAIHNFIRIDGRRDKAFEIAQQESYNPRIDLDDEGSGSKNETQDGTSSSRKVDDLYMSAAVRDMIAEDLMRQFR